MSTMVPQAETSRPATTGAAGDPADDATAAPAHAADGQPDTVHTGDETCPLLLEARRAAEEVVVAARQQSSGHLREARSQGRTSVRTARSRAEAMIANARGQAESLRLAAVGDRASALESVRAAERHLDRSRRQADALEATVREEMAAVRRRVSGPLQTAVDHAVDSVQQVVVELRAVGEAAVVDLDVALERLAAVRRRLAASPADATRPVGEGVPAAP